jgi:hypothetical protein
VRVEDILVEVELEEWDFWELVVEGRSWSGS